MKVKRKKSKISKCTEAIYQMAEDISDNSHNFPELPCFSHNVERVA